MSIRRVGNRWQVRVGIGGGRRVEQTLLPGATREDAKRLEVALSRRAIDAQSGLEPPRTLEEALDYWIETHARHLRSWPVDLHYRQDVVRGFLHGKTLQEAPQAAADLIATATAENLKPASINRYLTILRCAVRAAERAGWTSESISPRIKDLKLNNARHLYLTVDQVRKLAQKAGDCGDAILFAALTGLRIGESLGLTPANIRDGCIVLTARTKSGKPRVVPMPREAARIASRRLPWGLTYKQVYHAWKGAREACGLPDARIHDLRHTYASWLIQGGAGLAHVRDLLGHSTLAVTNRYSHLSTEHLRGAVANLPRVNAGKKRA